MNGHHSESDTTRTLRERAFSFFRDNKGSMPGITYLRFPGESPESGDRYVALPPMVVSGTSAGDRTMWFGGSSRAVLAGLSQRHASSAKLGPNGPDPTKASTVEEFVATMRALLVWAGEPTLRELENRAGPGRLPRSSVSDALRRADRLPKVDLLAEFVKACGAGAALPVWLAARQRLREQQASGRGPAAA